MIRAHKIRLNPTPEQEVYFRKAAGTKRFVYNWALARWKWAKSQGMPVYGMMAAKLDFNAIMREQFPWTYEVAKDVCEGAFQDLGAALKNYFDSKSGKRNLVRRITRPKAGTLWVRGYVTRYPGSGFVGGKGRGQRVRPTIAVSSQRAVLVEASTILRSSE